MYIEREIVPYLASDFRGRHRCFGTAVLLSSAPSGLKSSLYVKSARSQGLGVVYATKEEKKTAQL